ncbi:MAG: TatD family deoxyribonuclease [Verrucomicrobia bacterium]|nr:TatD family deoxyribonuclease [Verrucomicrobiota bacterium]NBU08687.1 TatD family deoxyribonuclease [Pseudomonadota bacterium]NDD37216.1 TatD family deoxyribonuclease [Verrucomicrobiota bacterium]
MKLYDAHNHLQDERFGGRQDELMAQASAVGVAQMVVNGSCEADWPQVAELARRFPGLVVPSFGYHPWYLVERTARWEDELRGWLDRTSGAVVGEIGLDRWKPGLAYEGQEAVFLAQLGIAAERNLAASMHCLQAWGRMLELLRASARPARGFVLHSYGGPVEMVAPLAKLGAHFSFPGYFIHERKGRQRETFKHVPIDRLLVETDAPDQLLPDAANLHPLTDLTTGKPLNHPANLPAVLASLAQLRGVPTETLAVQIEANFQGLFGSVPRG